MESRRRIFMIPYLNNHLVSEVGECRLTVVKTEVAYTLFKNKIFCFWADASILSLVLAMAKDQDRDR